MEKNFNPDQIPSTLDADFWEPAESRKSNQETRKEDETSAGASHQSPSNKSEKKNERKLPDWMIKAGKEKSKSPKQEKEKSKKSSPQIKKKPDDIYIMSDEDLVEVARYFIKNK